MTQSEAKHEKLQMKPLQANRETIRGQSQKIKNETITGNEANCETIRGLHEKLQTKQLQVNLKTIRANHKKLKTKQLQANRKTITGQSLSFTLLKKTLRDSVYRVAESFMVSPILKFEQLPCSIQSSCSK